MAVSTLMLRHRVTIVGACVVVAVMAVSACAKLSLLPRHPEAQGAVARLLSDDQLLQEEAQVELLALGEGAMPELRERFGDGSPEGRRKIVEIVSTIGKPTEVVRDVFIEAGRDSASEVRQVVAFRSAQFPQLQRELFPTLHLLAFDATPEVQAAAITTLGAFSAESSLTANELEQLMRSDSPLVVAAAATAALPRPEQSLREATIEVLPILVGEIMNPSPLIRASVIIAIGKYGPAASPAAPPLAGTLAHDPLPEIRLQAALALMKTKMRSARAVALPALKEFAQSPNPALAGPAQRVLASEPSQALQHTPTPRP
ncbi:MAG: Adaptin terminal region [Pseudomonadota bacterium]